MNARFFNGEKIVSADTGGIEKAPAVMVELSGGFLHGKDTLVRPATDEDKAIYGPEYTAFLAESAPKAKASKKDKAE